MKKTIAVLLVLFSIILLLEGCRSLFTEDPVGEITLQEYFNHNESTFAKSVQNIKEEIVPSTNGIYRIRPYSESLLQLTPDSVGSVNPILFRDENTQILFNDKIFDLIMVDNTTVLYCCSDINSSKGIAFVSSDHPQDIHGYSEEMNFQVRGAGFWGRIPNTDNTFYYVRIKENWFYYEACT